tara:strand:- start:4185 stop:4901 length:717 start_codon:yes stop_codon:yes gene_type:complete
MLGIALSVASAGASFFGGRAAANKQAAQTAYSNTINREKTRIMNAARKRQYNRQVKRAKEQIRENFAAANASFQTEQAKFHEQMMSFAFAKEGMLNQVMEAEGYGAATETYGKSADRARAIKILGEYGRNQARFDETVASSQRQYGRNLSNISGSLDAANVQATAFMEGGGPMPVMAQQKYSSGGGNALLQIGNALSAGLSTYSQTQGLFDFSKPPSKSSVDGFGVTPLTAGMNFFNQ